jgi:NAD(P) transhydrogenase subunit alpha
MQIGVIKESAPGERRVAATPDSVAALAAMGASVVITAGAGEAAGFADEAYAEAGATVGDDTATAASDIVLTVGHVDPGLVRSLRRGAALVGFLDPFVDSDLMRAAVDSGVTAFAMEAVPRTTLAQAMDALSSQTNLAGYAAVLVGAGAAPRALPMMVTAAGTIPPAKVLVLGVGVAGLQAIATARRLGAVVHAYDIRVETREQVESLGAKFVAAPTETADEGGYAKEVGADTQAQQHAALAPFVAESDLIVSTAQIPGRRAPLLVTDEMVASMRPGSVIVDMAAGTGGNVEGSAPDEAVVRHGVIIHGPTNLASHVATDASRLYARNVLELLKRAIVDGELVIDLDDEIIGQTAVVHDGGAVHPRTIALLEAQ